MAHYSIREWDKRYEVDTKGRDWKPGAPKWVGPLRFVRLKVSGRALGPGFRRLQIISGKENTLRDFGLFCKLLEIAAAAPREDRNVIPDAAELAFILDLPKDQIEQALTNLLQVGWISSETSERSESSETSEHSEIFRKFGPTEPNRTEPNRTEPKSTELNRTEQTPLNRWEIVRRSVEVEFGRDRGHKRILDWLASKLLTETTDTINRVCARLEDLRAEAVTKDNPAAWFQVHTANAVGYPATRKDT